jgi:hypothetical protein
MNASARSYRSRYGGGPPILRSVWCPERGWLEWNPVTKAHDIPITDDDRLEMLVAQDERDAIQLEG